jgi:carboxyl-terminal processing protease
MVAAVGDPYTVFLTPSNNKVVQEDLQGSFDGIGIQIGFKGTQLAVIAPLPGSPAEKAGVEAGDLIVGIRDEKKNIDTGTVGITLPDAVQMIRGEKGTSVELALLREGEDELIVIEITRDSIEVPSVVLEYVGEQENIAHIKVLKFGGETKAEWDNAVIDALTKKDLRGIILDVRNNPGGYLQGAVELGTDFLEVGSVVVVEETYAGEKNKFKVEDLGRLRNQKTIVLVNKGSASASEILAGALRDDRGIILVGEKTFGKGTIQEPQQINNGAGLHITIARWLTPDGIWVDQEGLTPDHELEDNPDTEEDEQLEKAIELINNI